MSPSCSVVFFNSLARSRYLSLFQILSVLFCGLPGQQSRQLCRFSFFLLIIIRSGFWAEIKWSVCISNSHRCLCLSFSRTGAGLCIHHLSAWSNLNFLYISQWITLPTQSCLALYSLWANLLHPLIMWLMVSSLSLHSLHLLIIIIIIIIIIIYSFRIFHISVSWFIIIIIIIPFWVFIPVLADSFSLEVEWQQVSSILQDSSQYSGWSQ